MPPTQSEILQTRISGSAGDDPAVVELVRAALVKATAILDRVVPDAQFSVEEVRVGIQLDASDENAADALAKLIVLKALEGAAAADGATDVPDPPAEVTAYTGHGVAVAAASPVLAGGAPAPKMILLDPSFSGGVRGKLEKGGYRRQGGHASLKEIDKKVENGLPSRANLHGATVERLGISADCIRLAVKVDPHVATVRIYSAPLPPAEFIGPHSSDAALTGPVRFYPTLDGNGELVGGRIDVDEDLHRTEIVRALGNEIDLIAGLLKHRHVSAAALRREMRAEQMQGARASKAATLQDEATAAELQAAWLASYEGAKTRLTTAREQAAAAASLPAPPPPTVEEIRVQQVSDLTSKLRAWGLLGADDSIGSRIDFLEQHLTHDVLHQLIGALHFAAVGATAALATQDFSHLMKPTAKLDNALSYISGGHSDGALKRWIKTQPKLAIVEVGSATKAGLLLRKYAQMQWLGAGPIPAEGDPDYPTVGPAGLTFDPAKWSRSGDDKTTVEDMTKFLREAEDAWQEFVVASSGAPALGAKGLWSHTSTGGVPVKGYAYDLGGGTYDFASVFPDASRF